MPTVAVQAPPTTEPVPLAQVVAWLRLDLPDGLLLAYTTQGGDTSSYDPQLVADLDNLSLLRGAAREAVEAYTGRYFAPQTLALTYELGEPYLLPAGAVAQSVSGFFTDLDALADLGSYLEEYRKGISVNGQIPFREALQQTYTVVADVPADTAYQALAKRAMLEIAAGWFKDREPTQQLPISWKVSLAPARRSVIGESEWG